MKILIYIPDAGACGWYRAVQPYLYCKDKLSKEGIDLNACYEVDISKEYDVYIFPRIIVPSFIPFLYGLKCAKKKIIWSIDDDFFNIPKENSASEDIKIAELESLKMCLSWSDLVISSTEDLKKNIGDSNLIHVLPNLINTQEFKTRFPSPLDTNDIQILWSGSISHTGDLALINSAIIKLAQKYSRRVTFTFFGYMHEGMAKEIVDKDIKNILYITPVHLRYYWRILELLKPNIALLPLDDNKFNRAKSNIKWLEMTLAGAGCIGSPVTPYSSSIDNNRTGVILPDNSPASWEAALEDAITNPKRFQTFNELSRKEVYENFTWRSSGDKWVDFFKSLKERWSNDGPMSLKLRVQGVPGSENRGKESSHATSSLKRHRKKAAIE